MIIIALFNVLDKLGDILDGIQATKFTDRLFSAFDEFKASLRDRANKPKVSLISSSES
jgi:hypothetical protein